MYQKGYKDGLKDDASGMAFEQLLKKVFHYVNIQHSARPIYEPTGLSQNANGPKVIAVIKNAKGEYHTVTITAYLEYGFTCKDDQNNCASYWSYADVVYYATVAEPIESYNINLK